MRISDLGEFELIERLKGILGSEEIGDDCAHIKIADRFLLLTADLLLEDVHFLRSYAPEYVGWKAVSVNVSDVVGNGGYPEWILVSLILPDVEVSYVERLYAGIREAFKRAEPGCGCVSGGGKPETCRQKGGFTG